MTVRSSKRIVMVAVMICATSPIFAAGAQQVPARDTRPNTPAPSGTATLSGTVTTAAGNASPVRLASVVLIGSSSGVLRVTSTDDRGRFSFSGLPADRYLVGASKAPFLGSVAGAKRPARSGTPIAVKDGETIADVSIRMPLGAAIAGVITDEQGQPATGALVGLQQRRMQGGERVWLSVNGQNSATDERGRYRFYGLPPGEYAVVALAIRPGRALAPARALTDAEVDAALRGGAAVAVAPAPPADPSSTRAPVYFPGTTRESDATPIALAAGDDRQSVDFRLESVRTATVAGSVAVGDGQPATGMTVNLSSASPSNPVQSRYFIRTAADGAFTVSGIPPGTYVLDAREPAPPGRFATATIDVAGTDRLGLQLTLRPPLTLSARIAFDGTSPPAMTGRRVPFRAFPASASASGPGYQVTSTDAAGLFTVTGLSPGQYIVGGPLFFGATSDSVTWTLQSVVADGRDVTDLPLVITADAIPKDVVVTYGDRWQELAGRLRQSSNAPATDFTMILFPVDKQYWVSGTRRILTTRPDTDGQFRLGGPGPVALPAGNYLLAAVTDLDREEQFDPAFLAALVTSAIPVSLQPGEKKAQDVVIK